MNLIVAERFVNNLPGRVGGYGYCARWNMG